MGPNAPEAVVPRRRPTGDRFYARVVEGGRDLDLSRQGFSRVLFRDCTIAKMAGATFSRCCFERCRLESDDLRDILTVTATLNCETFDGLELSPAALDAVVFLVSRGVSDVEKQRIRCGIDPRRRMLFEKVFPQLE